MDPNVQTRWVDEAACHVDMRDAGYASFALDLEDAGVEAADINWIVSGLMDPAVLRPFWVGAVGGGWW